LPCLRTNNYFRDCKASSLTLTGAFPKAQPRATYRPKGAVAMRYELI